MYLSIGCSFDLSKKIGTSVNVQTHFCAGHPISSKGFGYILQGYFGYAYTKVDIPKNYTTTNL